MDIYLAIVTVCFESPMGILHIFKNNCVSTKAARVLKKMESSNKLFALLCTGLQAASTVLSQFRPWNNL
jgi:hypothetical protein